MTRSTSVTGSAKPARCSSAPRSRRSANGATRGDTPPSISASAAANACAQLGEASPPISAARNRPSGLSARRIWISAPGRSLTNCSASADTTRSSEPSRTAAPPRRRPRQADIACQATVARRSTPTCRAAALRTPPACRDRRPDRTCRNTAESRSARSRPRHGRAGTSPARACARARLARGDQLCGRRFRSGACGHCCSWLA